MGRYYWKYISFFLLTYCLHSVVMSQDFSQEVWHFGELDLHDGKTIKGKLHYDLKEDIVQIWVDGRIKTFSPTSVLAFQFKDEIEQRVRYFYSMGYTKEEGYATNYFFELVYDGRYALLSREYVISRMRYIRDPLTLMGRSVFEKALTYDFFLFTPEGTFFELPQNVSSLCSLLGKHQAYIQENIEANHISITSKDGMMEVVQMYDSLQLK